MERKLQEIKINELTWQPEKNKNPILCDVNTEFREGHFYGILGPNGAGKTSLVRQILGLIPHNEGEILFDGISIKKITRNEMALSLSFLSQNMNTNADFTVSDIIAMGREPHRKRFSPLDGNDLRIIEEAMEFTKCAHLKDKSITRISSGERQRVMIARTIAQDTPWIILDEPVSNLDIKHQVELMQVLEKLRKEKNRTIIAILHDINLAVKFCDYIVFMKDGKIFSQGKKEKTLTKDNLAMLYGMDFDFYNMKSELDFFVIPKIK